MAADQHTDRHRYQLVLGEFVLLCLGVDQRGDQVVGRVRSNEQVDGDRMMVNGSYTLLGGVASR